MGQDDFNSNQRDMLRGFSGNREPDEEAAKRRRAALEALKKKVSDFFSGPSAAEAFTKSIDKFKQKKSNNNE